MSLTSICKLAVKKNCAGVCEDFDTVEELEAQLEAGRVVRLRGQDTGDRNTLNGKGVKYA